MGRRTAFAMLLAIAAAAPAAAVPTKLANAAPSVDALIDRFLGALATKDRAALHRLRVTEREYRDTILAGTVEKGQPLRAWPDDVTSHFWGTIEDKSRAYEDYLLNVYGGRRFRVKSVSWDKGVAEYATYTGWKQLRLELEDEAGAAVRLATGSVAEVDGQYKFVSFIRD
jgi:hypothetical protein